MTKIRIYEYAKKQNVSSKEIIERLKDLKIEVKNHMATIAEDIVEKLNSSFQPKSVEVKQPQKTASKPSIKVIPALNFETSDELDIEVDYQLEDTKVKSKKNSNKKKKTDSQKQSSQNEDRQTNGNKKGNQNMNHKNNSTENNSNKIVFSGSLKVSELAKKLGKEPSELIKKLFYLELWQQLTKTLIKTRLNY